MNPHAEELRKWGYNALKYAVGANVVNPLSYKDPTFLINVFSAADEIDALQLRAENAERLLAEKIKEIKELEDSLAIVSNPLYDRYHPCQELPKFK